MQVANVSGILTENISFESRFLERTVKTDLYLPRQGIDLSALSLLLINDGQNLKEMGFESTFNQLISKQSIQPLLCVGIHAGPERKMEYGVAGIADFKGRGARAGLYSSFILQELLPFLQTHFAVSSFKEKAFAGFSLGGLMALDMVWSYPDVFTRAAVFSGSLWWRSLDQTDPAYNDDQHRIIHQQVRKGAFHPGLQFFFQCGNMDETRDRNKNGIIDSIDDTLDLIRELEAKGYVPGKDIQYVEMPDGRHDIATWARSMPLFLEWAWGVGK